MEQEKSKVQPMKCGEILSPLGNESMKKRHSRKPNRFFFKHSYGKMVSSKTGGAITNTARQLSRGREDAQSKGLHTPHAIFQLLHRSLYSVAFILPVNDSKENLSLFRTCRRKATKMWKNQAARVAQGLQPKN